MVSRDVGRPHWYLHQGPWEKLGASFRYTYAQFVAATAATPPTWHIHRTVELDQALFYEKQRPDIEYLTSIGD